MKLMKLVVLGNVLAAAGALLMIVKRIIGEDFPEPLSYVAAIGLLAGAVSNVLLLCYVRKNGRTTDDDQK